MAVKKELSEKLDHVASMLDSENSDIPGDVSRYFVRMAILGMNRGTRLQTLRKSFLKYQNECSERVNASFNWLEAQLKK